MLAARAQAAGQRGRSHAGGADRRALPGRRARDHLRGLPPPGLRRAAAPRSTSSAPARARCRASRSPSAGAARVEAEVVDVGVGRPRTTPARTSTGKIVMVDPQRGLPPLLAAHEVVAHGGAAMLYVSGSPENLRQTGTVRFAQKQPAPIPTVTVGARRRRRAARRPRGRRASREDRGRGRPPGRDRPQRDRRAPRDDAPGRHRRRRRALRQLARRRRRQLHRRRHDAVDRRRDQGRPARLHRALRAHGTRRRSASPAPTTGSCATPTSCGASSTNVNLEMTAAGGRMRPHCASGRHRRR